MLKVFRQKTAAGAELHRSWDAQGVVLSSRRGGTRLTNPLLAGYLSQLRDDGFGEDSADGFAIAWDALFEALVVQGYEDLAGVLELPPAASNRQILRSSRSLADVDFAITLAGWEEPGGRKIACSTLGAVVTCDGEHALMRPAQWRLHNEVAKFARREGAERTDMHHRREWGRIRKLAEAAAARLDEFLFRSVVLTPDKLRIGLRKKDLADDRVIEIEPGFDGAPTGWLDRFDRERGVLDLYNFNTSEGIVQVVITPQIKSVLQQIKRLPGRRVAGARAQAFVLNPFATLGESAADVVVEEQFEAEQEAAGLGYERFLPAIVRDDRGFPARVGLRVESSTPAGVGGSEEIWLDDDDLREFVAKLKAALDRDYSLLGWRGYDFELSGEAQEHLRQLGAALEIRSRPKVLVSYDDVHRLGSYSCRVEDIGVEKPYYSPYIERESGPDGWFPDNIDRVIVFTPPDGGPPIQIAVRPDQIEVLRKLAGDARKSGQKSVAVPWLPAPIPLVVIESVVGEPDAAGASGGDGAGRSEPVAPGDPDRIRAKTLVIAANISAIDYAEWRQQVLQRVPAQPELPRSLAPGCKLYPHQEIGLAWLQHLHRMQTMCGVRGAVLADDMGLGKTLQLLAFMAWLVEQSPDVDPMLVVAPVTLLENWKEEADRFLQADTLKILMANGPSLAQLRVDRAEIDRRLIDEDGLLRFLKPGWIGDARVVLTTYETLRDLEFSFAAQRWSVMICDEAQKIKNPAAMVTRAAKKQNVGFKIACTGTPVENTLADLWCLFDLVQPGLLGALNDFGGRYRKPIEAKTEDEKARVEELRQLIAPQILRRRKEDVVELPPKTVFEGCMALRMSAEQKNLYAGAIEDFNNRHKPGSISPFKNHLGLLQYLRVVCTDPRRHGMTTLVATPLAEYRRKAPKLDWLLDRLQEIRGAGEKAIVFCEFRTIQRLLQHYIEEVFGVRPDIINGDTTATVGRSDSRQKRLLDFQVSPGFGVVILSPVAVGVGVNVQGANHVIHYTRTWNPAKEDQATSRAYRIGQRKEVFVYYPIVRAEFTTFDVKINELLEAKRELAKDMLNGAGDVGPIDIPGTITDPTGGGSARLEALDAEQVLALEPRYFEALAAALWSKQGYANCYVTPGSGDGGVDAVAIRDDKGVLIQTKHSQSDDRQLGWDAIKDVVAGHAHYCMQHPGVQFGKVAMTNARFNESARQQALANGVDLIEKANLVDLLKRYPTTLREVELFLYTAWSDGPGVDLRCSSPAGNGEAAV